MTVGQNLREVSEFYSRCAGLSIWYLVSFVIGRHEIAVIPFVDSLFSR